MAELAWTEPHRGEWDPVTASPAVNRQARRCMARLLELGVPRESVVRLLGFWHRCDPEDLNRSLAALAEHGYGDVGQIFDALGETLWRARHARNWNFVIDVVGARELSELARFGEFLHTDTLPDAAIVYAILNGM
ncbi:hypothetical protein KEX41_29470 (plasmid) [Burkholderia thailandensis]|uniref:hypothetical protein n=1 Tax=Burkholderia thailandensis TaxID=57975 RepID=UPI00192DD5A6|nr:hypothetical protein [Burkholderia thailandensis]MBS2132313.1 hypothetical protein [Burkholderia thailandensis]QRA15122.1 hypothetical protein JMY07_29895 [Burkholderia thailandensis]